MPTIKQIMERVEEKETATQSLRKRWDADYGLWRNDPYMGMDTGYKAFSSVEPAVNAQKAVGMISGAIRKITVPEDNDSRSMRDADNVKERFLIGNFKANDERLIKIGLTGTLQQTMAWQIMVRGTTCGRVLFRRRGGNGRAIADATPMDPRDCFWQYDADGLAWFCHRFSMLRSQAERDWQVDIPFQQGNERPDQQVLMVYDWYDRERNTVGAEDTVFKDEIHGVFDGDGDPMVPAWVNANTLQPQITPPRLANNQGMTESQLADSLTDYGESIFKNMRHPIDVYQRLNSNRLNLADRSLKPVFSIESESGVRRVEYDPWVAGAEIPLKMGEKFIIHEALRTTPDTDPLTGVVISELQKAGFPAISFGNLNDPISGFAIQNLKGGVADKVIGGVQACNSAFMTIGNVWTDHFATAAFGGMELSGRGRNRRWFSGFINPDMVRDLPQAEIELVPELPEDQAGIVNIVNMLRQAGVDGNPVLSDYALREDYLNREDSGLDADSILEQQAVLNPLIRTQRTTDALVNRGDEGALWSHFEFMMNMFQMFAAVQGTGVDINEIMKSFNPQPGVGSAGETNFPPQVLPSPAAGNSALTPGVDTPAQAGRNQPLGTPRPGAQGARDGRVS